MNKIFSLLIIFFSFLSVYDLCSQTWEELKTSGMESLSLADYKSAAAYFEKALSKAEMEFGINAPNYIFTASNLAIAYRYLHLYAKAETILINEISKINKIGLKESHILHTTLLSSLADSYRGMGNFQKAESLYTKVLEIRKSSLENSDPYYIKSLVNLSDFYVDIGAFTKAEPFYNQLIDITKDFQGESRLEYTSALNGLGLVYTRTGNYSEAEILFTKSLNIIKEFFGNTCPEYVSSLNYLGLLYNNMQKYNKAIPVLISAMEIKKMNADTNSTMYATIIDNLATSYNHLGDFQKAEPLYLRALNIRKEKLGSLDPDLGSSLNNLSVMYARSGEYSKAETLYTESLKLLYPEHPFYNTTLMNLAVAYWQEGNYKKTFETFKSANANYIKQLNSGFISMSEPEKMKFLKSLSFNFEAFYSFAVEYYSQNPDVAYEMMNLSISTKGIVLSSNTLMRYIISNSGSPELQSLFERFCNLQNEIIASSSLSPAEQNERSIDIATLEREANSLEKKISSESVSFKNMYESNNTSFQDVINTLSPSEAVVEFVEFRYWNREWSDTVHYIALVSSKNMKSPALVNLCTRDELSDINSAEAESENSYVSNSQVSSRLYKLVWEPLEPYLKDIEKVYVSPSGLLNKVSFAALNIGNNSFLIDKYKIRYAGNLKDVVQIKKSDSLTSASNKSAVLFGGLNYDADENILRTNAAKYKTNISLEPSSELNVSPSGESIKWNYLKGTLREVSLLNSIISANGFNVTVFTGADGSEEAFKSLSGKNAPYILHIATHGFFNPAENQNNVSPRYNNSLYGFNAGPYLRSGLILSGANSINQNGIKGIENGMLSAYEVSTMNLSNVNLIVLSACETGLGDIKGTEGVFGLQRAFKTAGAKNIIMSLWKVPDQPTAELMETFYKNWLENRLSTEDAFSLAQSFMRKKYPSPRMWAAFILQ